MSFPRADELKTPPVVGKFYMVPCIWAGREWWPITGPQHEDAEIIGFKTQHRHYDLRFVSPLQMDRLCERGWWKRALHWPDDAVQTEKSDGDAHSRVCIKIGTPRYRRLKCWREQPPYQIDGVARLMWVAPLEQKLASAKVKCGKCPHRGLPLESLPRVPGTDIVTCPGHGLRWDLKTGELHGKELHGRVV